MNGHVDSNGRALVTVTIQPSDAANSHKMDSIQLSCRFLILFKIGVPLVMMIALGGSASQWDLNSVNGIGWLLVCIIVLLPVVVGWRCARLVSIRINGDDVIIGRWRGDRVFPLPDLLDVLVMYRRGIPWAVFRFSNRESSSVYPTILSFYTVLKPDLNYMLAGRLADLTILEGVPIRYTNWWGRERLET
jgi:hypothetical protein